MAKISKASKPAAPLTAAEFRAQLDASRIVAMRKFKSDWGTDSVAEVLGAIREVLPQSSGWGDVAGRAHRRLASRAKGR